MAPEKVPEFQEKWIKLFEQAPFFMSSQIRDSNFSSDYHNQYMEERAFQIPDPYMLNLERMMLGDVNQLYHNWCKRAGAVMFEELQHPWEQRQNKAFWHGSATS